MPEIAFQYQIPQKMIGTFVVDAFIAEHYQFSNSVTDIPVEEGSNINDHVVEDQDVISVEAFIGNVAFEVVEINDTTISNLQSVDRMARVRQAYHELKKLSKEKRPLDVVLGLETFSNMEITSFSVDRDAETGANLPFSMEFRKLKIVHSDTTTINASSTGVKTNSGTASGNAGSPAGTNNQTSGTANAGTSGTEQPKESIAKEEWRRQIRSGGPATPADYQRKFGVPYPQ